MWILVIEDDARLQALLTRGAETQGHSGVGACGGPDVLALAGGDESSQFVGLRFQGLSGLQMLQQLNRLLPVLVLPAHADLEATLTGSELDPTDSQAKPTSLEALLARVQIEESEPLDDKHILRAGAIVLDLVHRQALVGELVVDLSIASSDCSTTCCSTRAR